MNEEIKLIMEMLPFLIPIAIIQMILMLTALIHVIKHPNYRFGNMILWVIIVMTVSIIGPIVYFALGKGDD